MSEEMDLTGKTVKWTDDCAATHLSKVLRMVENDMVEIDYEDTDNPGSNQLLTIEEVDLVEEGELERIKARAAEPAKVLEWASNYSDEYVGALEKSQEDVEKLVALIEKIRDDAAQRANQFEATADRLGEQVRTRDPEVNAEDAQRYANYAAHARASANIIDRIIKEGPTP